MAANSPLKFRMARGNTIFNTARSLVHVERVGYTEGASVYIGCVRTYISNYVVSMTFNLIRDVKIMATVRASIRNRRSVVITIR